MAGKSYVYKDARLLALWARIGLIYAVAADVNAAMVYIFMPGEPVAQGLVGILLLLGYILIIPFLVWLYRVSANAKSLKPSYDRSVWAVYFWYFVPFAGIIMPYFVMSEIWHASSGGRARSPKAGPLLLKIWWVIMLVRGFGGIASVALRIPAVTGFLYLCGAGVAVCFVLIVDRLQKMQTATYLARTFDEEAPVSVLEAQTA